MISLYSPSLKTEEFMPVPYYYYDRASMNKTTPQITDHQHSLHEIMYVSSGRVKIVIDNESIWLTRHQYIWLDASVRHKLLVPEHIPLSMLNVEYQFEPSDGRCLSTMQLYEHMPHFRALLNADRPYLILTDDDDIVLRMLQQINQLAGLDHPQADKLCSQIMTQILMVTAKIWIQGER